MTEALRLWAKYNLATDEKVAALLDSLEPAEYTKERKTYYNSLAGLHLHFVQTYKVYQSLIRTYTDGKHLVSPLTEASYEVRPAPLAEVARLAIEYDKLWLTFAETVTEAELRGTKHERTLRNGRTYRMSVEEVAAQYMNHTTHHRGQLSQLLDELGVDHDIGGILGYAEEVKG